MREVLSVEGMSCKNCARSIERVVSKVEGVRSVRVSFELGRVEVLGDFDREEVIRKIEGLGYRVKERRSFKYLELTLLIIFTFLTLYFKEFASLTSLLGIIVGGRDVILNALKSLKLRVGTMDTLVGVGVVSSYLFSLFYEPMFETPVMVLTFVKVGKTLEEEVRRRSLSGFKKLLNPLIEEVLVLEEGKEVKKVAMDLFKGDRIILRSGDRAIVDGKVVEGEGYFDSSVITGESEEVLKKVGDRVRAGEVLKSGYVILEVEKPVEESYLFKVSRLIDESLSKKTRVERLSDKVAHYFVFGVLTLSFMDFLFWFLTTKDLELSFKFALSMVVVSCPCSFGIAVPLAVVVGNYLLLKRGIVLKEPSVFEKLKRVEGVVFDKTGTLTIPREVRAINLKEEYLPHLVYLVKASNHPVSRALYEKFKGIKAKELNCKLKEVTGVGLFCGEFYLKRGGDNLLIFGKGNEILATFKLEERLKDGAKEVINFLKSLKYKVIILSGDTKEKVERVAKELKVDEFYHSQKPEDKRRFVEGKKLLMVGDGINDVPALTSSYVSVAVREGSELTKLSGDVVVPRLSTLMDFFKVSLRVYRKIRENLFWAFFYNTLFIPVAGGLLYPLGITLKPEIAGLLMALSSLTLVLNTLSLLLGDKIAPYEAGKGNR